MPLEKEYFNEIDDEKQEVLREEYGDVMEWEFLSEIEPEECGCWKDQICDECKSKWYNGFVENDYQLPYQCKQIQNTNQPAFCEPNESDGMHYKIVEIQSFEYQDYDLDFTDMEPDKEFHNFLTGNEIIQRATSK